MPTTKKYPKGQTFQMRADDDFLQKIDDWRIKLRPVPSRAEAIRLLVDIGIKASKKG